MGISLDHFFGDVDENLICAICREVLRNPVSCRDGHTFCEECVLQWLNGQKNCPMDRRSLIKRELIRNLPVRGLIENLDVRCRNSDDLRPSKPLVDDLTRVQVCPWLGKARDIDDHLRECEFEEVLCPHALCDDVMLRKFLDAHAQSCRKRLVMCDECGIQMAACDLEEHVDHRCPLAKVPCVNECMTGGDVTMVSRAHMQDHICFECENALVACPFEPQGCSVRAPRSELDHHVDSSVRDHMLLLAQENRKLKDQLLSLSNLVKVEINSLRDEQPNTYIWNIQGFSHHVSSLYVGEEIQSPKFWLCGVCWKMRLYPNGASGSQSSFMSLYLERQSDEPSGALSMVPNAAVSMLFRFVVVSPREGVPDYAVSIDQPFCFTQEDKDWGWVSFIRTSQVRSYCSSENETLKIKCVLQLKE